MQDILSFLRYTRWYTSVAFMVRHLQLDDITTSQPAEISEMLYNVLNMMTISHNAASGFMANDL